MCTRERPLGDAALLLGNLDIAADRYAAALRLAHELLAWLPVHYAVAGLAAVAARRGDTERAGMLWGAVTALEVEDGWTLRDYESGPYEEAIAACRSDETIIFAAAAERGRRLTPAQIVTYALQ